MIKNNHFSSFTDKDKGLYLNTIFSKTGLYTDFFLESCGKRNKLAKIISVKISLKSVAALWPGSGRVKSFSEMELKLMQFLAWISTLCCLGPSFSRKSFCAKSRLDIINFIWKVNVGGKVVSGQDNKILTSWQWQSGWFWWQSESDPINSRSFSAHSNWFSISDFQSENGCHKLHLQWKIGPIKHSNICPTQMNCFLFLSWNYSENDCCLVNCNSSTHSENN